MVVGKLRLLHLSSVGVVLTNGLGIPFTTLSQEAYFARSSDPETTWTAVISMTIFIVTSLISQLQSFYKDPVSATPSYLTPRKRLNANLFFWFLLILGILGIGKFMLIDGGISFLGFIFSSLGNLAIYYATRKEIGESLIKPGQGFVIVVTSMNYLLPAVALLSSYYAANRELAKKKQYCIC